MALNLSTLTNPATSGDVLAEALTTADFLEGVPVLRNLARGSQKGGDAKQDVALNQPRALPLIKNPSGNLGGYLYIPNVSGNYATGPIVTIGSNETWEGELDMVIKEFGDHIFPMGGGDWSGGFGLIFYGNTGVRAFSKGISSASVTSGVTLGTPFNAKYGYDGTNRYVKINDSVVWSDPAGDQSVSLNTYLELNQQTLGPKGNYAIQKAKLTVNSAVVFDCDFNGSTSIRHGDTKFQAAVGGPVSLIKAGNDPVTVVKKSVLRFANQSDGSTSISLAGLLNQTITDGYMFAAFSVLGDGGETYGRVFGVNSTGSGDGDSSSAIFSVRVINLSDLGSYINGNYQLSRNDLFDDANGDVLHECLIKNGNQVSRVNNADEGTDSLTTTISSEEFNLVANASGGDNAAIDLEYLALFDSSITDAQADSVRNYINNRNNVFDLKDGFGYYFYDAQKAPVGNISSGSSSWNGRIVGSDFGDTDRYLTQGTSNDAPVGDGFKVTFADNTDHLEIPSTAQAGWQVVGTSLGTFAYRVNANAVTELNLLGNAGGHRSVGDSYGIILLPASATGADIEEARSLLINRGAADGTTASSYQVAWYLRSEIKEFKSVNMTGVTNVESAWNSSGLISFDTPLPSAAIAKYAFYNCTQLSDFRTTDIKNGTDFTGCWQLCSSLTSFPQDAKLGTAVSSAVNFKSAWESSGLTSFSTPLPTATSLRSAFHSCTALISFDSELPEATRVDSAWTGNTSLSDFRTTDIKNCSNFISAWQNCSALTSFPAGAKLGTEATGVNFSNAWRSCSSLTSFPLIDTSEGTNFGNAWHTCNSLTSFPLLDTSKATSFIYAWNACNSLTSFPELDASKVTDFFRAWRNCTSLTSFPQLNPASAVRFGETWAGCSSLTSFPANFFDSWSPASINNGPFNQTWDGCTALTAQSVENILTSIDASNQHGTDDGTSTGNPLGDSGIDIDYDGTTLSAATNAAIDSLIGKGWQVYINGVLTIPNVLTLAPAAAYSLRSFDADADPNVVNVRRSSDSALRDFKASEVSDGTLTSWVNAEYNRYTSDFSSGVDGWVGSNVSWTNSFDPLDANNYVLKIIASAATSCRVHLDTPTLNIGQSYNITAEIYIPSTNNEVDGVLLLDGYNVDGIFGDGEALPTNQWVTVMASGVCETNQLRIQLDNNDDDLNGILTSNAIGDIVYVKNVQVTQLTADGHVTKWHDQRQIVETGSAYGTTISGTADGTSTTHNQIAPAVAGEFYRVRFTASNINPRGRIRYRNYASSADVTATAGLASVAYFSANGDYESYVPSDDGLSLWFIADAGQSFDYSGVSVQQVAEVPNDATQTLVSNMPKLVDGGTLVTEGGLPALDFDTGNGQIRLAISAAVKPSNLNNFSLFTVQKATGGNGTFGVRTGGSPDSRLYLPYNSSGTNQFSYGDQLSAINIGSPPNTHQLLSAIAGSTQGNAQAFINGASQGSTALQDIAPSTSSLILGQGPNNGSMQEVIMFHNDQSANRTAIETNINSHFTIYS
ncbi:hypothetical protein OAE62_00860 [bacterium]|nr:hypothetical protein [bacterium]